MPDDCLIGFDFKAETKFETEAAQHIAAEITRFEHVRKDSGDAHLDYAKQSDAATPTLATEQVWDDNVPPDMSDSFDFVLL